MVKDIMEMAIEDKLDQKLYPFLSGRGSGPVPASARRFVVVPSSKLQFKLF